MLSFCLQQVVVYRGLLPDEEHTLLFVRVFYEQYIQGEDAEKALAAAQKVAAASGVPENVWASYYVMKKHVIIDI